MRLAFLVFMAVTKIFIFETIGIRQFTYEGIKLYFKETLLSNSILINIGVPRILSMSAAVLIIIG